MLMIFVLFLFRISNTLQRNKAEFRLRQVKSYVYPPELVLEMTCPSISAHCLSLEFLDSDIGCSPPAIPLAGVISLP